MERDALISEATAFLSSASELSDEERDELADLIIRASEVSSIADVEEATAVLREAYDRMRGY